LTKKTNLGDPLGVKARDELLNNRAVDGEFSGDVVELSPSLSMRFKGAGLWRRRLLN